MNSLNYYYHLSGHNTNFYLSGYGAYWYGTYPDGQVVTKINGVDWSYSDKMFVSFINDLQNYSKWKYSGEGELLMLEYKDGILFYDNMMWDRVIVSIASFFQQLFETCKGKKSLKDTSNVFGKDKLIQVTKEIVLNNIPSSLLNVFTQEKYFCVRNCKKANIP